MNVRTGSKTLTVDVSRLSVERLYSYLFLFLIFTLRLSIFFVLLLTLMSVFASVAVKKRDCLVLLLQLVVADLTTDRGLLIEWITMSTTTTATFV